jgi:hypothetical protein
MMCEILRSALELKIAVIGNDLKGLRKAFKIYAPIFECFCNGKHFIVIDPVVAFGFIYRL